MSTLNEYHLAMLDDKETFRDVINVLAQFFQDSFKDDPAGVSDWLARTGEYAQGREWQDY